MKAMYVIAGSCLAVILSTAPLFGQEPPAAHPHSFVNLDLPIPAGNTLDLGLSYPVFSNDVDPIFSRFAIGISGVLQLTLSNEGIVGNMLATSRPLPTFGMKVQILPRRGEFPPVAIWVRSALQFQGDDVGNNDIQEKLRRGTAAGLNRTSYEYRTSSIGLAVEPLLTPTWSLNVSLGLMELRWRDLWIHLENSPPGYNGYHLTGVDRELLLHMTATTSIRIIPSFILIGEVGTLPYLSANTSALRLESLQAYAGTVGFRYSLPIPLNVDAYLRWQSNINDMAPTQFRIGLSSQHTLESS